MAMIDMSEVLTDPTFLSLFSVVRRTQGPNNFGETVITLANFPGIQGVVYPATKNDLLRLPEEQRQNKAITVVSKFAFQGATKTGDLETQPDVVVWNGNNYLVVEPEDWSQYGSGFVKAICTMTDFEPTTTVTK